MKNNINIAVVGLGQVGSYLLNELNIKKKDIELKTGKKINIVAISARNINKKRQFKINKKIFFKNALEIFKNIKTPKTAKNTITDIDKFKNDPSNASVIP